MSERTSAAVLPGRSPLLAFLAAAVVLAAILMAFVYATDDGVGLREFLIVVAIDVVVAAVLFWILRRPGDRVGTIAVALGIVAVVSLVVF
ncbi:MAG: hypothetical protein ICV64_12905, partial [Thermoleophilia bacterium]|nr:hypothetical protein [Thermoleophilia bacterium]